MQHIMSPECFIAKSEQSKAVYCNTLMYSEHTLAVNNNSKNILNILRGNTHNVWTDANGLK